MTAPALAVEALGVSYRVRRRWRPALRDVSFTIPAGGAFGLVGESGCGKSTVAWAVVRHLADNGRIDAGIVRVDGTDVRALDPGGLRRLRAERVSMVYQHPTSALNPSMRVGDQVAEAFTVLGHDRPAALDRARAALTDVAIADPGSVMRRYPHQLSGGMAQRVVIAMALAKQPALLVLDEPTTGLDATVEAEVLELIDELRRSSGTAVLLISHNLAVVRSTCDEVGVLYGGRLVETGPVAEVMGAPQHPYTVGLLRCLPQPGRTKHDHRLATIPGSVDERALEHPGCVFVGRCPLAVGSCHEAHPPFHTAGPGHAVACTETDRLDELVVAEPERPTIVTVRPALHEELISAAHVSVTFRQEGRPVHAVRDVSLTVRSAETVGLVGESGSGKSTLARTLVGMVAPDPGGHIELAGEPLAPRAGRRSRQQLRSLQMVFQDPASALNPRRSVRAILRRAVLRLEQRRGAALEQRVSELGRAVQLTERSLELRAGQLSGGLKQRAAIARSFAGSPRVVICDEPTSALDVSVQAAVLNLLDDLQTTTATAYLFISHDLAVVRHVSDRIAVMYLGEIVEQGPAAEVFDGPHHPYTEVLLASAARSSGPPVRRPGLGEAPGPTDLPSGCPFHTRCPRSLGARCEQEVPDDHEIGPGHVVRCHLPVDSLGRLGSAAGVPGGSLPSGP